MNFRSLVLLSILSAGSVFAQPSTSDCIGAIELCGGIYTETSAPQGYGSVYEFTGACNQNTESSSLWYTFTVQEAGLLSFVLTPANYADDYDWGLFNISNGGCAGIQNGNSPEVNCNSYGLFGQNGLTGISSAYGGTGTSNGPGNLNGPAFNADLPVQVGQTYALVMMNWSGSTDGYTIDFTQSTASLYDQTPPEMVSVEMSCTNESMQVTFSENIVTNTVQATDFIITTPSGATVGVSTVTPGQPGVSSQEQYELLLQSALQEAGMYILTVTSVSGNVEDPCGNIVVDTTFEFNVVPPLRFEVDPRTACNGTNGGLVATHTGGGTAPFIFRLLGSVLPNGTATGLGPGDYLLTLDEAGGCQSSQMVSIADHLIEVLVPQDQDSLSCTQTSITIEGLQVVPQQIVSYSWTAVTGSGTNSSFSSSAAPEVSQAGVYTVLVTDAINGCTDEATVVITPSNVPTVDLSTIFLPNVISPNGDGHNDIWRPYILSDPDMDITHLFDTFALTVFNRWGQVVHETSGSGQRSWNGRDAAEGTYYYVVSFRAECGTVVDEEHSGSITVLR